MIVYFLSQKIKVLQIYDLFGYHDCVVIFNGTIMLRGHDGKISMFQFICGVVHFLWT